MKLKTPKYLLRIVIVFIAGTGFSNVANCRYASSCGMHTVSKAVAGMSNEINITTDTLLHKNVYLDSLTFASPDTFSKYWDMLYPWGPDHNGSARMFPDNVVQQKDSTLKILAFRISGNEGNSSADPHLAIAYRSGAIHAKQQIEVTDKEPYWVLSGDFKVPAMAGSWPAFWITGVNNWPPEIDIMEFKGSNTCWQNTITGPDWRNVKWQTNKTAVSNAEDWHNYKLIMYRASDTMINAELYVDGVKETTQRADFMNKPFWLIINLQMEGSSGAAGSGPQSTAMQARNVYMASYNKVPDRK